MAKAPIGPTLTYLWAERLIRNLCWWFHNRHRHLPLDDLIAEANWAFMTAYHSHDETKGDFEPWLRMKVTKAMYELLRQEAEHRRRYATSQDVDVAGTTVEFYEPVTFDSVTQPDECEVVKLAFAELWADGNKARYTIRADVMRKLRKRGWTRWRRDRAFRNVGTHLSGETDAD